MQVKFTPQFNAKNLWDDTVGRFWIEFETKAFAMGAQLHKYMQGFINAHRHRRGGSGNLARAIDFVKGRTAPAIIEWGIGSIDKLMSLAPYYYVINYGKKISGEPFIPGGGKFIPGSFEGDKPNSALKGGVQKFNYGDGSGYGMRPGSVVRSMHYIEATRARLNARIRYLINSLKGKK